MRIPPGRFLKRLADPAREGSGLFVKASPEKLPMLLGLDR